MPLQRRQHLLRRRRSGFTMLELLVVAMLGAILITFVSNVWRWYGHAANHIQVTAHLERELRLAADAIAADFGPSLAARTVDGSNVQFDFDTDSNAAAQWDTPDTVIEYVVQNGNLVRRDLSSGNEVPMAANISEVTAEVVDGHLNVKLIAAYRNEQEDVTLQLQEP
jgi:prepilin-type N-terminal cleavage/methylation domain-containing protein